MRTTNLTGQGTTSAAEDVVYTYDKLHLLSIEHANGLYGNDTLSYSYDPAGRLAKEIYPNGRAIEFGYDAGWRLSTVKDPFGFINTIGYDNDGRLGSLNHTTLGTATFDYNNTTDDRLMTLTLGNGAKTQYTYDTLGRLNSFDIKDASNGRLVKHNWAYDNMGRKGDITIDTNGRLNITSLDVEYDSASRVTQENVQQDI